MASYQDILKSALPQQKTNPGYGNEVPRYNALDLAPKLAQAIVAAQSEARTKPAIEALSRFGEQYRTATDEAGRQSANALANAARAAYVQAGGSPMELPQQYWGSSPTSGFQTSADKYDTPYTGLEGMTTGQREKQAALKRQAILDALGIRQATAEITGYDPDTGKPTLDRWYKERYLAKAGSGGSSGGYSTSQRTDDLMKIWQLTGKAPAGLEGLGVSAGTPLQGKGRKTDEEMYQAAMATYLDTIDNEHRDLNDVYKEIDRYMLSGAYSQNLGEIMKAKLNQIYGGSGQANTYDYSNTSPYDSLLLP